MVVWRQAEADLDWELAHQPLGNNLGFWPVAVAFGECLALGVVLFDDIVVFVGAVESAVLV